MRPTIGRTVLYVMPAGHLQAGEIRPAIITKVWSDTCVNLRVITDPHDADIPANEQSSVSYSERRAQGDEHQPRSWHWPPRS